MNLSYWERKNWFTNVDYTIVGSGIVGIFCALNLRERFPDSKILILEKGILPQGASTKNAGFACFGSISEIIDDLKTHTEEEVIQLIQNRKNGIEILRKRLGDDKIDYKPFGGYELFLKNETSIYEECLQKLPFINEILKPIFKTDTYAKEIDRFGFSGIHEYSIFNPFEGQIDTGNMMQNLLKLAVSENILILNNIEVGSFLDKDNKVEVEIKIKGENDDKGFSFETKKLLFATNGFASKLTNGQVIPARAQVIITEPIKNLDIKGTFHIDKGYVYFRNIDNRILIGGARNIDFETENTTEFGKTNIIQNRLEELLKEVILPNQDFKIESRWSGIMGLGNSKTPIIEQISENVSCGVRLGGMGVAIGSLVGTKLAELIPVMDIK